MHFWHSFSKTWSEYQTKEVLKVCINLNTLPRECFLKSFPWSYRHSWVWGAEDLALHGRDSLETTRSSTAPQMSAGHRNACTALALTACTWLACGLPPRHLRTDVASPLSFKTKLLPQQRRRGGCDHFLGGRRPSVPSCHLTHTVASLTGPHLPDVLLHPLPTDRHQGFCGHTVGHIIPSRKLFNIFFYHTLAKKCT